MTNLRTTARGDYLVDVWHGRRRLCRYNTRPLMEEIQGRRPYLHPVSTLGGTVVTEEKHFDHEWHNGISMTCPWLSGYNFWGGPTYVRGEGYQRLDNLGRQRQTAIAKVSAGDGQLAWRQSLDWLTPDREEPLLTEERLLTIGDADPDTGSWALDFDIALLNTSEAGLLFGSPTTEGREMAGYGGVFWRGPLAMLHGTVRTAEGKGGDDQMGVRSPWLAYTAVHATTDQTATLVFLDHPENIRFPLRWFVRTQPFPLASFAFAFDEYLSLDPGRTLQRRHRILVCDGEPSGDQIEAWHAQWLGRT